MKFSKLVFLILSILILISCETEEITTVSIDDFITTISENPSNGQFLGTIAGTTNNGIMIFEIVSETVEGAFYIDSLTGGLYVADSVLFDYEINPELSAVVMGSNSGISDSGTVTIHLSNNRQELKAIISNEESQISLFENTIVLDGSNSIGEIESYKWELINAPDAYNVTSGWTPSEYYNSEGVFPNESILTFHIREIGEYTIRLTVTNNTDTIKHTSSNDFNFNVNNNIPDFTYTQIHTELFDNINDWTISNDSIDDHFYDYDNSFNKGGAVTIENGTLLFKTGTFDYWKARKNLSQIDINSQDNIKVTIRSSGDEFGYKLDYSDVWDNVSNMVINVNNSQISFRSNNFWPNTYPYVDEYFFRENLANKDLEIFILTSQNSETRLVAICGDKNISERFTITNVQKESSISFLVYSQTYHAGGGLNVTERICQIDRFELSKFE